MALPMSRSGLPLKIDFLGQWGALLLPAAPSYDNNLVLTHANNDLGNEKNLGP